MIKRSEKIAVVAGALLLVAALFFFFSKDKEKTQSENLALSKIGQFSSPVYAAGSGARKGLYIVEKEGRIILKRGAEEKTFLDIRGRVLPDGERGLLSLAFAPDFASSKLFYVYFTDQDGSQVVFEGKSNGQGERGRLTREILRMEDFASNHNGGQIVFGPGGLFVGTGDGGGSGDPERTALDLNSLLGKILRINPLGDSEGLYGIPKGNPFVGNPGARPEIFSYGLRNPWRFSIAEGRIFIADVGQDDIEEINAPTLKEARGSSFGWSRFEGSRDFNEDQSSPGAIFPALEYKHKQGRCSVTGGYLVEGAELSSLQGRYVYGDFCSGEIRSFLLQKGRAVDDRSEDLFVPGLVSFAEAGGQLLVISNQGQVYKFTERSIERSR